MKYTGQSVPHESARGHVTGTARYTEDLILRHPGCLYAWPVMSPHARALVVRVDMSAALDEPGVVTTLVADDAPGEANSGPNRHDEPLFPMEVMHHRQPVAWVLATSLEAAKRGTDRVDVEYRPAGSDLDHRRGNPGGQLPRRAHSNLSRRFGFCDREQRSAASR